MSEYDPVFDHGGAAPDDDGVDRARELFVEAARPFLTSPWSWLAWALILPGAALATPGLLAAFGPAGALLGWSVAVLLGGAVELVVMRRQVAGRPSRGLARWAFRAQGNLSLVAVALSLALGARSLALAGLLPGLWLLLLGHSLFVLGGLAFRPLRTAGWIYQIGGAAALWPGLPALTLFAVTTAAGNLWMAWSVWRRGGATPAAPAS